MRAPEQKNNGLTRRGAMLLGIQFLVVGGLGYRIRQLQVVQADKYRLLAEENRINIQLIPPTRGLIYDRNGKPLAQNQQNYRITIMREQAGDPELVLSNLARLIPFPPERREKVLKEIRDKESGFVHVTVAEHLTWKQIARVAANAPALPGITPEVGLTRSYPQKNTSAHVVGYVGPTSKYYLSTIEDPDPVLRMPGFQIGKSGFEQRADIGLRGRAGNSSVEVNSTGRVMRELERTEGTPGQDLHLTIDSDLQAYAMKRMEGESAAAVVIDVKSGDMLINASVPSFDPNAFVLGISTKNYNALLNNPYRPLYNKAVSGAYPPGSTFKMVVMLAALNEGVLSPNETVYCPGHYELGNRRFHCWRRGGHGKVDIHESLKYSCDVFYYDVARRVGIDKISEMANRLGIGIKHDLPLPAVNSGLTPDRAWKERVHGEGWLIGDTLNSGIGQGFILASPLQLAVMVSRIATGNAVTPRLVRAVEGVPTAHEPALDMGLAKAHLDHARQGMFQVVNSNKGTGYRSRILDPKAQMAGKTGTSQVRNISKEERARGVTRNRDLPWERRDHALFVSYAPFDDPKYAIAVVVEHGGGGSVAAAPIARDIMMRCLYGPLPPLSVYPSNERKEIERKRKTEPEAPIENIQETGSDRA